MAIQVPQYRNLTFEIIKQELIAYAASRSDYGSWKDFLDSSSGTTLIELMAGLASFLSFHSLAARRESYLESARLYTSGLGVSNFLGYPANRKTAPKIQLEVTLTEAIYWEKTIPIGAWNLRNLSLLESQTIPAGTTILTAVFGEWKTQEQIITESKDFNNLRVIDANIDNMENERVILRINDDQYELTKNPEDLLETEEQKPIELVNLATDVNLGTSEITTAIERFTGEAIQFVIKDAEFMPVPLQENTTYYIVKTSPTKYKLAASLEDATAVVPIIITITDVTGAGLTDVVPVHLGIAQGGLKVLIRTVYDGVILMFGDNLFGKKVLNNDVVALQYIWTEGVLDVTAPLLEEVNLVIPTCTLNEIVDFDRGSEPDSLQKLQLVAPAYHSTKRRMVTPPDHKYVFMGYAGDIISANARRKNPNDPPQCCTVQMCYLFPALPDHTQRTATPLEKADMIEYLSDFKMVGEQIEIVDPKRTRMEMKLTVVIYETQDVGQLIATMKEIIRSKTQILGDTFHIGEVIVAVTDALPKIRRIYLHWPQNDKVLDWDRYIYFDEVFFDANLVILTTDPYITVPVVETGYVDE